MPQFMDEDFSGKGMSRHQGYFPSASSVFFGVYAQADEIAFRNDAADKFVAQADVFGDEKSFDAEIFRADFEESVFPLRGDSGLFGLRENGENIELQLQIHGGIVSSVNFYGDFIDASLPDKLRPVIVGKKASELTDLSVQNLFVKF